MNLHRIAAAAHGVDRLVRRGSSDVSVRPIIRFIIQHERFSMGAHALSDAEDPRQPMVVENKPERRRTSRHAGNRERQAGWLPGQHRKQRHAGVFTYQQASSLSR
jgi:hypothetical protein